LPVVADGIVLFAGSLLADFRNYGAAGGLGHKPKVNGRRPD
jgi:hypothetical protein